MTQFNTLSITPQGLHLQKRTITSKECNCYSKYITVGEFQLRGHQN